MKLSFVIPCYRSEGLVGKVIREIHETVGDACDYEIIAINDNSPDNVWHELRALSERDNHLILIDLAKNMGKHAALMAGYSLVTGDIIVNVDDDGQCPLDKLWELIAPLEEGYDISIARYPRKKQKVYKNIGSRVNEWMTRILLGKPKELQLSNFSALKRFICEEMLRYKNPYPYIDGLYLRSTSRIKNVDMEERERISGESGYTFRRSFKLWMNGFTAFSIKPLRIATVLGLIIAAIGFFFAVFFIIRKLLIPEIPAGYSSMMAVQLFIGGIIMILLGMIGEYVGRVYISINNSPQYVIREIVRRDQEAHEEVQGE